MLIDDIFNEITSNVRFKQGSGQWRRLNCPMCVSQGQPRPDRRGRGGFLFTGTSIVFNCFNCGFKASYHSNSSLNDKFIILLNGIGIGQNEIRKFKAAASCNAGNLAPVFRHRAPDPDEMAWSMEPQFEKMDLPHRARKITEKDSEHMQYLHDRGFRQPDDWSDVWVTDYQYCELDRRIIIPFRDRGRNIIGWSGRIIDANVDSSMRYHNMKSASAVYGLDHVLPDQRFIFITEGVFDAKFLKGIAVCCNTCNFSTASIMNRMTGLKIVVPDNDAAGEQLAVSAGNLGWWVARIPLAWECKDAADACLKYGRHYVTKYLVNVRERMTMPDQQKDSNSSTLPIRKENPFLVRI